MAGLAFGEVTRLVYDAIWSEFCDWGLEFAKVRLADERLEPAAREATWWTLVEVLDTYLRLLHPVMPFVTEALWAALPHRASDPDLLIVARWPGVGERDVEAEREVGILIDLVTEIRNARSSAKVPAADWLEAFVSVPQGLGPTFEALRPAVERLARARPLHRELTREALAAATGPGTWPSSSPAGRSRPRSGSPSPTTRPPPSSATGSPETWPTPKAGWRPRGPGWPTRRSRPVRRPPWSRERGRAKPSWPTRSPGFGSGSATERDMRGRGPDQPRHRPCYHDLRSMSARSGSTTCRLNS